MLVIIVISILNFYRSIIQQNKEIQRNRFKRLEAIRIKEFEMIRLTESRQFFIAIRNANFKCEFCCGHEILNFEYAHLINEQCSVNCCRWNDTSEMKVFQQSPTSIESSEEDSMGQTNNINEKKTTKTDDVPEQTEKNSFRDENTVSEVLTLENIKANYLKEDPPNTSENYGKTGTGDLSYNTICNL